MNKKQALAVIDNIFSCAGYAETSGNDWLGVRLTELRDYIAGSTEKPVRMLYRELASLLQARLNCIKSGNNEWLSKHTDLMEFIVDNYLPSGSGFDNGTTLDIGRSTPEKLVFTTAFHHMDENGMYDGWTDHTITVRPSLAFKFTIAVSGRNKRDIKEFIAESFDYSLSTKWTEEEYKALVLARQEDK